MVLVDLTDDYDADLAKAIAASLQEPIHGTGGWDVMEATPGNASVPGDDGDSDFQRQLAAAFEASMASAAEEQHRRRTDVAGANDIQVMSLAPPVPALLPVPTSCRPVAPVASLSGLTRTPSPTPCPTALLAQRPIPPTVVLGPGVPAAWEAGAPLRAAQRTTPLLVPARTVDSAQQAQHSITACSPGKHVRTSSLTAVEPLFKRSRGTLVGSEASAAPAAATALSSGSPQCSTLGLASSDAAGTAGMLDLDVEGSPERPASAASDSSPMALRPAAPAPGLSSAASATSNAVPSEPCSDPLQPLEQQRAPDLDPHVADAQLVLNDRVRSSAWPEVSVEGGPLPSISSSKDFDPAARLAAASRAWPPRADADAADCGGIHQVTAASSCVAGPMDCMPSACVHEPCQVSGGLQPAAAHMEAWERRFYRGQRVWWCHGDGATPAVVVCLDCRSDPILYRLLLQQHAEGGLQDGPLLQHQHQPGEEVLSSAVCMLPLLGLQEPVMVRLMQEGACGLHVHAWQQGHVVACDLQALPSALVQVSVGGCLHVVPFEDVQPLVEVGEVSSVSSSIAANCDGGSNVASALAYKAGGGGTQCWDLVVPPPRTPTCTIQQLE